MIMTVMDHNECYVSCKRAERTIMTVMDHNECYVTCFRNPGGVNSGRTRISFTFSLFYFDVVHQMLYRSNRPSAKGWYPEFVLDEGGSF